MSSNGPHDGPDGSGGSGVLVYGSTSIWRGGIGGQMTYQDIIALYGNPTRAASELNYSVATLYLWKRNGIPTKTQLAIQAKTEGRLMADLSEQETMERERYGILLDAFKELAEKCVSTESMETLIRETGFDRKHLQQIIKESGKVC